VHELSGDPQAAAGLYRGLHQGMQAQASAQAEPDPPVVSWFHATWSREVFAASPVTLKALAEAHAGWRLSDQPPAARARGLLTDPRRGGISQEALFLSGATARARAAWAGQADSFAAYLRLFRYAEALVLRPPRGDLATGYCWYYVGALERARAALERVLAQGGRTASSAVVHHLALIAFREARWKDCVQLWERISAGSRQASATALFPIAVKNSGR
jgi:hypothetical protein